MNCNLLAHRIISNKIIILNEIFLKINYFFIKDNIYHVRCYKIQVVNIMKNVTFGLLV